MNQNFKRLPVPPVRPSRPLERRCGGGSPLGCREFEGRKPPKVSGRSPVGCDGVWAAVAFSELSFLVQIVAGSIEFESSMTRSPFHMGSHIYIYIYIEVPYIAGPCIRSPLYREPSISRHPYIRVTPIQRYLFIGVP